MKFNNKVPFNKEWRYVTAFESLRYLDHDLKRFIFQNRFFLCSKNIYKKPNALEYCNNSYPACLVFKCVLHLTLLV